MFVRFLQLALVVVSIGAARVAASSASEALAPVVARPATTTCAKATAFVGTICAPVAAHRLAAIIVLGGSEGGDSGALVARGFAAHGFVAASVAYFGAPGLPSSLTNVPVETVGRALDDLAKRGDVDADRIAVFGISKGGELALLAASTYPRIHAVVAVVPSPFGWQNVPNDAQSPSGSSWTRNGQPVPYVPYTSAMGAAFGAAFSTGTPLVLRDAYTDAAKDGTAVERAMFPLERIHGPVLFVTAGDDRIWDSHAQSAIGLAYLVSHRHPYADRMLDEQHAGHLFLLATHDRPFVDAPFANGLRIAFGGTADANVAAAKDAWPKIDAFLRESLALTVGR